MHSVKPYTKSDLASISLPNVIRDYTLTAAEKVPVNPLIYLYPDIPRDVAFGRYYTSASDGILTFTFTYRPTVCTSFFCYVPYLACKGIKSHT